MPQVPAEKSYFTFAGGLNTDASPLAFLEESTSDEVNTDWISGPVANCYMKGNHLGLEPHAIMNSIEGMIDDIETITGIRINPSFNRKGAEILF